MERTVTRPACMSPAEFALWAEADETYERHVGDEPVSPCLDCLRYSAFHLAALSGGTCTGSPGRRALKAFEDPATAARRMGWRAAGRRRRERMAAGRVA